MQSDFCFYPGPCGFPVIRRRARTVFFSYFGWSKQSYWENWKSTLQMRPSHPVGTAQIADWARSSSLNTRKASKQNNVTTRQDPLQFFGRTHNLSRNFHPAHVAGKLSEEPENSPVLRPDYCPEVLCKLPDTQEPWQAMGSPGRVWILNWFPFYLKNKIKLNGSIF